MVPRGCCCQVVGELAKEIEVLSPGVLPSPVVKQCDLESEYCNCSGSQVTELSIRLIISRACRGSAYGRKHNSKPEMNFLRGLQYHRRHGRQM